METVKGFQDISGQQALKNQKIKKIIVETFESYGFEPAETPIIEYEKFVKGDNPSDEAVSDIFKLKDKGNRKLALRYEFTFQLKRLAKNQKLPYKRFQIGPVFRDEPVKSNRFRQFTQCDVDIVGSTIKDEAEILACFSKIFEKLGIQIQIKINNRKLLNEILEKEEVNFFNRPPKRGRTKEKIKNKEQVIREIDKLDKLSEKNINVNKKILNIFKKPESYFKKYTAYKEIQELKQYCKYYNIKPIFQPSLARGLSYYNGSIFEIQAKNIRESLAGGGSFLIGNIQSTGISLGIERISNITETEPEFTKALIISLNQDKNAIQLAQKLRNQNISCIIFSNKISKALEYANSKKIAYAIFVGEKEVKSKKFTIKDLGSGKEQKLSEKDLVKKLG